MSRELFILRHSKSDWDSNGSDHARTLNKRGSENARQIAQWMKDKYLYPGLILCSTAARARQTLAPIIETLAIPENKITYTDKLYLAELKALLKILADIDPAQSSVMIVGHNPGLAELVTWLAYEPVPLSMSGKLMPTSCLAHFKLPDDWHQLEHEAELISINRVSELTETN